MKKPWIKKISRVHGSGLFAFRNIKKGSKIIQNHQKCFRVRSKSFKKLLKIIQNHKHKNFFKKVQNHIKKKHQQTSTNTKNKNTKIGRKKQQIMT